MLEKPGDRHNRNRALIVMRSPDDEELGELDKSSLTPKPSWQNLQIFPTEHLLFKSHL